MHTTGNKYMNVTELARKLNITTAELLLILPELGFDIGARAIKVSDHLVEKIIEAYKEREKRLKFEKEEAKITEIKIQDDNGKIEATKAQRSIQIEDNIIVKDLAEKMGTPLKNVMTELMKNGIMVSLNSSIDFDTASIIGEDLGFKVEKSNNEIKDQENELQKVKQLEDLLAKDTNKTPKPPVVVVMGHVDHGKTKLLDTIRKTNIIDTESGNITQHIGAYSVELNGKRITFLDTPGHEAFRAMRSRGTKIADVGIIVVAADEGLKPQTIESIELAQKENLPFVIAINKVDKPESDIEKVKKELAELNLMCEDWGGKTICVPISAKEGKNITELLEMVNLVAEMENLSADASRKAIGTIIESHIDKNQGPIASVLIQTGTLKVGDEFVSGATHGKVKLMADHLGNTLKSAGPSTPVRILGFKDAPIVGDIFNAEISAHELKDAKKGSQKTGGMQRTEYSGNQKVESEDDETSKSLNIILKTDMIGSQGAIIESIKKLGAKEEFQTNNIELKIVKSGLGSITDKDIIDGETTNSMVLGFHVKIDSNAELLAKEKGVVIKEYKIIYKLLEDLEEDLKKLISLKVVREQVGELQVLAIFKTLNGKMVIGGKVIRGKIIKEGTTKVMRLGKLLGIGKIGSLQSGKENVSEVSQGSECGLEFIGNTIIKKDDLLEIYKEKTV